jgi:hypothetical protein
VAARRLVRAFRRLSTVNTASATQTIAKPATRAGGIGSCRTRTPIPSCISGVTYCRSPIVDSGTRRVAAANSSSGTAVAMPEVTSRTAEPAPACPKCPVPCASRTSRKTTAGTTTTAVSTNRPGAASTRTSFFISP